MKASPKWTTSGYAVALLAASAVWGQTPHELFSDDFTRTGWENAMTNAFLPAWSAPGQGFVVPMTTGNGTPYQAEVVVTGNHLQVSANGQVYIELDDPDLAPGTVGVMSWAQRQYSSSYPLWGTRCSSLTVSDPAETTLLTESWDNPWKFLRVRRADNTVLTLPGGYGNMRWDFVEGGLFDYSNSSASGTLTPAIDFIGPTYIYNAAGSSTWTDYRVRGRLLSTDDDGMGFIVRYTESSAQVSFYRVSFINSGVNVGASIQKYVVSKPSPVAITWTELVRDPAFLYTAGAPLDVTITCTNLNETETEIKVEVINDPEGAATPYSLSFTDNTSPLKTGGVGVHIYGQNPVRIQTYGGNASTTPLVTALDDTVLIGNVLGPGYQGWTSTYTGGQVGGAPPDWGILLSMGDLCESSNGQQGAGVGADGLYTPYIVVKDGFNSGVNYTLRATLVTHDNDGHGLVFGFTDMNNYFRVGFRVPGSNDVGFPDGISVQKVVGGVTTHLVTSTGRTNRTNLAGTWIQKFGTMAIESSENRGMYANTSGYGDEFQGPRLVRGDTAWTDYTYETVIQSGDDDGFGLLFRYQDEQNHYRLTFVNANNATAGGPAPGITLHRVKNNVYTPLFYDGDPISPGDNDTNPAAGFIYPLNESWTARVTVTGPTIRIQIDTSTIPNFYQATVTDPDPLLTGKVGLHTWFHDIIEFRNIKVTLAGEVTPVFEDGTGTPDPKGWIDATQATMSDADAVTDEEGTGIGEPISGIGLRPDLQALGARDNRYIPGTLITAGDYNRGCFDFDGPRAVVGETNWSDYTYTVDLKALDDDGIGLVFRYADENNFYRLMFFSQNGNTSLGPPRGVSVQKRLNGTYSELLWSGNDPANNFIFTPGETWKVAVDCAGADFTIHITQLSDYDGDGKTEYTLTCTDPADPILGGRIGVTAWGMRAAANEGNTLLQPGGLDWTRNFSEGAVWDNVLVYGVTGRSVPDLNKDGKVNAVDHLLFMSCWTGPGVSDPNLSTMCRHADQNGDLDVDLNDFGIFQRCYSGELDFDPNCIK